MGRTKLTVEEKIRALTLLEEGVPMTHIANHLKVTRRTVYKLKYAAAGLPSGTIPRRKEGTGGQRKTSLMTDHVLRQEVDENPLITAAELKNKHPELLKNVAIRTIQHRIQKDLGLPRRQAASESLLTEKEKSMLYGSQSMFTNIASKYPILIKHIC